MVHDSPWMEVDEELRSKKAEVEEEHSAAVGEAEEDERHDRDAEAAAEEAGSMCQDELQRVHNIDDSDDLAGQEHTDDDDEEEVVDYGIHDCRVEERSDGLAVDGGAPEPEEHVPSSQSFRTFSCHLSLVDEEPRCSLGRHEEGLNTVAVATPFCSKV